MDSCCYNQPPEPISGPVTSGYMHTTPMDTCPGCGRQLPSLCPCCGRPYYPTLPYPYVPYYHYPMWYYNPDLPGSPCWTVSAGIGMVPDGPR